MVTQVVALTDLDHDPAAAGNGEWRGRLRGSEWTDAAVGDVVGAVAGNINGSKQL